MSSIRYQELAGVAGQPGLCAALQVYGPGGLMQHSTGIASKLDIDPGLYQISVTADPSNGSKVGTCYKLLIMATVVGTVIGYEQSFIVTVIGQRETARRQGALTRRDRVSPVSWDSRRNAMITIHLPEDLQSYVQTIVLSGDLPRKMKRSRRRSA